jgi:hypothetical protein
VNEAFFDRLDETPRSPSSIFARTPAGELRTFPISALARLEVRSARRPRLEPRQHRAAVRAYLIERYERTEAYE